MENQNMEKYLFHLTAAEYKSLLKNTLEELLPQMIREQLDLKEEIPKFEPRSEKDAISLIEAAELTGLKKESIYSKVSRLEMPCLMRGRPLRFSRKELMEWMRNGKPTVTEMNYIKYKKRRGK
jgi:excisionase family DNA binding protein